MEKASIAYPGTSSSRTLRQNSDAGTEDSVLQTLAERNSDGGKTIGAFNKQVHVSEIKNLISLRKQAKEHEQEIFHLRKHLSDFSVKEARLRNETNIVEKLITHMRLAFDQLQQDIVDSASKSLSCRLDIIEENVRLTQELQNSQQERSTFLSTLMLLLSEYSMQPSINDAQSIVNNVGVLFRHFHEKLFFSELMPNDSQHEEAPLDKDITQSTLGAPLASHSVVGKNGLDLVEQSSYFSRKLPTLDSSQIMTGRDLQDLRQNVPSMAVLRNLESDAALRHSAHTSSGFTANAMQSVPPVSKTNVISIGNSRNDNNYHHAEETQSENHPIINWGLRNSAYSTGFEDLTTYSAILPPVLEEPSSISEGVEDDPLPAIEGLQISGEPFPGRELQACGYSINGTTSCNFEWVRHLGDGSVNYIDGAKQPKYLVTADDVDAFLAVEVQPLDDRNFMGELVRVFANEHRKISCDKEMQNHIAKTLYTNHVSYRVFFSTRYPDTWEPVTLAIKREGCNVKYGEARGVIVTEKFSQNTQVVIPYGHATEFIIIDSRGVEHLFREDSISADVGGSRDAIVLTLRLFILRARERRKVKKKNIFFR